MIKKYLLVSLRNLFRNPLPSLVNIAGLAIGMTAFILIMMYTRYEAHYDDFYENGKRIYRIQQDRYKSGEIVTQWAAGCTTIGRTLYENLPEVEDFTRFQIWNGICSYDEKTFKE